MKKYKKMKITCIVLCLFSMLGCTDILDQEPSSIATPQNFWVSQANAETAVAGCYAILKEKLLTNSSFIIWGEFTAQTFLKSNRDLVQGAEGGDFVIPYYESSRNWQGFYRAANWALTIEYYVERMPDSKFKSIEEKNRIIGEAAFIRSLSYFYMARIWGEVPIVREVIENAEQVIGEDGFTKTLPRESEKKVLDYSLEAANKAISLLEYSAPGNRNWAITANKASAEALKAHIALWYASRDNGNPQMIIQSIDAATSAINNGNVSLIDYVAEKEVGFNEMCIGQSKTSFFEINISADNSESFRTNTNDTHLSLTLNFPILKEPSGIAAIVNPEYYGKQIIGSQTDRNNDVRKKLFFTDYNSATKSALLKYSQTSVDPKGNDQFSQFSEANILIFRLADIYLLRAEGYTKQGNFSAATDDLNMVRNKAGVPNYTGDLNTEALTKAVFDERAIELVGEGQIGFDRIRMKYFAGSTYMNTSRINKQGYFWPVDIRIISDNPAITQTNYWKGQL